MTGNSSRPCLNRREFLFLGAVVITETCLLPGVSAQKSFLRSSHVEQEIFRYSRLEVNSPVYFEYPHDSGLSHILVRLGERAGFGLGPSEDMVAFHTVCTHMGGLLKGRFVPSQGALGPCPFHLTTFDLKRFGMVVSGHATSPLPQVELKLKEDVVLATGFRELLYGRETNPA